VKIASVVGARPNFIKLAPVHRAVSKFADHTIVHTGQHYDYELSEIFFKEFHLPKPDYNLQVGSGKPTYQIGEMIKRLEKIFAKTRLDLVVVYGDTNSTFAGALSANMMGIRVAHVESGLRSFDRRMPEEINRVLTDHISDYLFAPTSTAVKNMRQEHVYGRIVNTGDVSVEMVKRAAGFASKSRVLADLGLEPKSYMLFTMHRAENTDSKASLISVIRAFERLPEIKIVFPIHPRTVKVLKEIGLLGRLQRCGNVKVIQPVGYVDFIRMMQDASKMMTDSGGAQKEAYLLSVPCITIRRNTEWIETVKVGWNILTDTVTDKIVHAARDWEPRGRTPPLFGDGTASEKIGEFIKRNLAK
jgi:UDP-N-acetylglucosamine 2-epimerase (non-hydrolysing)